MRRPNTTRCPIHNRPLIWKSHDTDGQHRIVFHTDNNVLHYLGACERCGGRLWPVRLSDAAMIEVGCIPTTGKLGRQLRRAASEHQAVA